MVKVYFEHKGYAELVATFAEESLFEICLPILEEEAELNGFDFVSESIEEN